MQIGEAVFLAIQIWRTAPAVICATRHRVADVLEGRSAHNAQTHRFPNWTGVLQPKGAGPVTEMARGGPARAISFWMSCEDQRTLASRMSR